MNLVWLEWNRSSAQSSHTPKSRHIPTNLFLLREVLRDFRNKLIDFPRSYTAILIV